MVPANRLECALSQGLPVEVDLRVDGPKVLGDLGELGEHALAVRFEDLEPLALVAGALPHERGVAADLPHRHAGGAKASDHEDGRHVPVRVFAVTGRRAVHVVQHEAVALVVAQGVRSEAGALGDFGNGETH